MSRCDPDGVILFPGDAPISGLTSMVYGGDETFRRVPWSVTFLLRALVIRRDLDVLFNIELAARRTVGRW